MTAKVIDKSEQDFYSDGANYWSEIPATVDGMLGGFGHISETDIKGSKLLLKQLFNSKSPPGKEYVLDCGAGIGRITKYLLSNVFEKIDMVEQNPVFLEKAKLYLAQKNDKVLNYFPVGLQSFQPIPKIYDVIWIQWVLGHLTDEDLIQFLQRCQTGLKENGVIVIKENITSTDDLDLDRQDSSVTRSMSLWREIFDEANLECDRVVKQKHFPKGLYSVYMFVLKPKNAIKMEDSDSHSNNDHCEVSTHSETVLNANSFEMNHDEKQDIEYEVT